ncbi:MAG: DNA repair protein RecO [Candidatus Nomurabacteria bacterium]|jgi:DNA repair protein RecO (recombination protein O)|nr:DNA repair protein RecO [Candidatus Nomurabacteria bacterium]
MSTSLRTDAIVLRRTNYGEADRILQVLTPSAGKLSVMARGVRREKSRLAGGIELFAVCDIVLHLGKSEITTLTGARLKTFFDQIMLDYDRMQFAYEAIKQVARAAETIDEPEFYELLLGGLSALNDLKIELKIVQTWFYLSLAGLLGNELNLATDNHGMKLVEDARYDFDTTHQVFEFAASGIYGSDHIKLLRVIANNPPATTARVSGVGELIDDCLRLAQIVAKV